jgi:hypothetical protein
MSRKRKRGYRPPRIREDVVNRLVEFYKKNHPEKFQTVTNTTPKSNSQPKVRESVVSELVRRYKQNHREDFPLKSPRKGFPHPEKNASA